MDLVEIFEVIFGAAFIICALIGSRQIFGGIFYSRKVRAVVGEKSSKTYVRIYGQRYTGRNDINLAEQRDRRRHKQSGDRKNKDTESILLITSASPMMMAEKCAQQIQKPRYVL